MVRMGRNTELGYNIRVISFPIRILVFDLSVHLLWTQYMSYVFPIILKCITWTVCHGIKISRNSHEKYNLLCKIKNIEQTVNISILLSMLNETRQNFIILIYVLFWCFCI